MRDIEQKIREVDSTMAMEGMPLTDEEKDDMRAVLRGEVSFSEMKKRTLAKYKSRGTSNERI